MSRIQSPTIQPLLPLCPFCFSSFAILFSIVSEVKCVLAYLHLFIEQDILMLGKVYYVLYKKPLDVVGVAFMALNFQSVAWQAMYLNMALWNCTERQYHCYNGTAHYSLFLLRLSKNNEVLFFVSPTNNKFLGYPCHG